jgi:hypothetical protein
MTLNRTGGTTMMTDDLSATRRVIGGVDTHKDIHVAVVIDDLGRRLDTASFATTTAGYRDCYRWLGGHGEILAVGVEGTGSWGAGRTTASWARTFCGLKPSFTSFRRRM